LGYFLANSGKRVLLVDSDPQGSARDWAAARDSQPPFTVIGLDRPTIHRDLNAMASDYDHVVIDGPPRVSDVARSGIIAADLVVIPIQPSPYDVWAATEVINLIKEASVFKEKLIYRKGEANERLPFVNLSLGDRRDTCKKRHVVNKYFKQFLVDLLTCPKMIIGESNFCTLKLSFPPFLSFTLAHK
jgi:MinD-like ATPase involved in chromosome partitioning or flagellar assembly